MEHFKCPFGSSDLQTNSARRNVRFFAELSARSRRHPFFSHPFLTAFAAGGVSKPAVAHVLVTFYQVVSPFTGLLCWLAGRAPDLRSRFAVMDNIYEEMGAGQFEAAHPSLYLAMLESIGVGRASAEVGQLLPAIAGINSHLHTVVVEEPFAVACAVLAAAESTIPDSFPVMAKGAREAFPDIDLRFFDRHGARDAGHSNDAAMLFAATANPAHYASASRRVDLDLHLRCALFDEWLRLCVPGAASKRTAEVDAFARPRLLASAAAFR